MSLPPPLGPRIHVRHRRDRVPCQHTRAVLQIRPSAVPRPAFIPQLASESRSSAPTTPRQERRRSADEPVLGTPPAHGIWRSEPVIPTTRYPRLPRRIMQVRARFAEPQCTT